MKPKSRKVRSLVIALIAVGAVAWLDIATGYEVTVFLFYAFPVAWVAWNAGLSAGLFLSALSTAAWRWADAVGGHPYSHAWIPWEKALSGMILFSFIAFSFNFFKRTQEKAEQRLKELESVLPICTVCHRIDDGKGRWTDFELHLREHSKTEAHRSICPDCASAKYQTDITL